LRFSNSVIPRICAASATRRAISCFGVRRIFKPKAMADHAALPDRDDAEPQAIVFVRLLDRPVGLLHLPLGRIA
jgi:hypothetical protein